MKISPYLMFNGNAEEAANFYAEVLDGSIENLYRYADFPPVEGMPPVPEQYRQRVGHCCIASKAFPGGTIGIADTALPDTLTFGTGIMLTLSVESAAGAEAVWSRLCVGAKKIMCPLQHTFYAELYGELTDRFGVQWAVMYEK